MLNNKYFTPPRIGGCRVSALPATHKGRPSIRSFEALRALFVIIVFLTHTLKSWNNIILATGMAIVFFFMLSGFVLSMSFGDKIDRGTFSYKTFILRRVRRICPLYYTSLFIFLYVMVPIGWVSLYDSLPALFMVQSLIPGRVFSGIAVGWFASAIMLFYLLFPLMYRLVMAMSARVLAISTAVLIAISAVYTAWVPSSMTNGLLYAFAPPRLVDCFLGIVVYRLYRAVSARPAGPSFVRWMGRLNVLLPAFMVASYALYVVCCPGKEIFAVCYFVPVGALIFLCASSETLMAKPVWLVRTLASSRILVALGAISFEIYFLHAVVRCKYRTTFFFRGWEVDPAIDFLICASLTLVAALCWHNAGRVLFGVVSGIYKKKCATSR